ncbi:PTS sugar transporter subunit IIA [Leuconostoc miyukkimchii]|uniref:PTS sugar transporter subunit IIA n=1 Tax=Leuconostoc miyukkimchii TaxID=910540 RepID=UPI001C7D5DC7|nr:PTS sugar transporter subunit IIA [Leuconostoc miyukkimchii]
MSWWQNLFNQKSRHHRIKTTGQINAVNVARNSEFPVVVAPVTGQLRKIDDEIEQLNSGNGFMILPDGNSIMSPVSGIVVASDTHKVTIQSIHHEKVTVHLQGHGNEPIDAHLATYGVGQQLHAGDLIGTTHDTDHNIGVYVTFEDNVNPHISYGAVYAGQNIWHYHEGTNATE